MSEDWKVGDLAVCVASGKVPCPHTAHVFHLGVSRKEGRTYRVVGQEVAKSIRGPRTGLPCGCIALKMECGASGVIHRFRKLNDGTDDAELIARIKRCQPLPTKEPHHV